MDPERWYDYYKANGWKVGRTPMKDWKASVRNWERTEKPHKPDRKKGPDTFFNYEEKPYDPQACLDNIKETEKLLEEL